MKFDFNIGPFLAGFICCGWPLIVHAFLTRGIRWLLSVRNTNIRIGSK